MMEKPWKCPKDGCKKGFKTLKGLSIHWGHVHSDGIRRLLDDYEVVDLGILGKRLRLIL